MFTELGFPCAPSYQPQCEFNEVFCPGKLDSNGCVTVGTCETSTDIDLHGFPCPPLCQPHCEPSEKLCEGPKDLFGCPTPGICAKGQKENGILCPPVCPIKCSKMQIQCPGLRDEHGCALEDFCIKNGIHIYRINLQSMLFVQLRKNLYLNLTYSSIFI